LLLSAITCPTISLIRARCLVTTRKEFPSDAAIVTRDQWSSTVTPVLEAAKGKDVAPIEPASSRTRLTTTWDQARAKIVAEAGNYDQKADALRATTRLIGAHPNQSDSGSSRSQATAMVSAARKDTGRRTTRGH